MVVPFYEPEKITVKKVLQNSLGTFATHILPAAEDEQKKIADSKETECSHVNNTSSNEEQVSELNDHVENEIKPQESLIIVSKNEGTLQFLFYCFRKKIIVYIIVKCLNLLN